MGLITACLTWKIKHVVMFLLIVVGMWWLRPFSSRAGTYTDASRDMHCYRDFYNDGRLICKQLCAPGYYFLPPMDMCKKLMSCREMQSPAFFVNDLLGSGKNKAVYHASYHNSQIAYAYLVQKSGRTNFKNGLSLRYQFQSFPYINQLVGYCKDSFVMELQPFGHPVNLPNILRSEKYRKYDTLAARFELCISYVEILNFLHTSPLGPLSICDSNSLDSTLKQFLLTNNLKLVLNDLDEIKFVTKDSTYCGNIPLADDFNAPEQRLMHAEVNGASKIITYNTKSDIWKIPDICTFFLGNISDSLVIQEHLSVIHQMCKSEIPDNRPNAKQVLEYYQTIQYVLNLFNF